MMGTLLAMDIDTQILTNLCAQELREMVNGLLTKIAGHDQEIASRELTIAAKDREILYRQTKIDQLTHEMAVLNRWKFGRSREQLDAGQISLLDETIDAGNCCADPAIMAPPVFSRHLRFTCSILCAPIFQRLNKVKTGVPNLLKLQ